MFSHKDVLPSGRILVFMITLGKTFFYLSVSTFIIASQQKAGKIIDFINTNSKVGDLMGEVVALKDIYDDFEVQFEVITPIDFHKQLDERQKRIACGLASIDDQLAETQTVLDRLNSDIDRLTNRADALDYMVAVGSGVLSGIIDVVCVGDFSLDTANHGVMIKSIVLLRKLQRCRAITVMICMVLCGIWKRRHPWSDTVTDQFGSGLQHHLRDFSHHPTPVGLFFLTADTIYRYGLWHESRRCISSCATFAKRFSVDRKKFP